MTNQDHVDRLLQGVEAWNSWREKNPQVRRPILRDANLQGVNLNGINLQGAILIGAKLYQASFYGANLQEAILSTAIACCADFRSSNLNKADLRWANLQGANFRGADLRDSDLSMANLVEAQLYEANLSQSKLCSARLNKAVLPRADLSRANLTGAKLIGAELIQANLLGANCTEADFTGAGLTAIQALATNFERATLTGACIEDWHIYSKNNPANLNDVICEYIFLENQQQERLPHDRTKTLASGDFAKLVQQSLHTVSLIFREGLDWRAFAYSFQQLQVQYADEQIAIQSIENKGDGTVIVKLAVAPDSDRGSLEQSFWRGFETAQKTITGQYEARLEDKDKYINQLFALLQQSQEELGEVSKLMAENSRYNLRGAKFGGGFAADGGTQTGGIFNDFSQNINEISSLIQSLRSIAESFPEAQRSEAIEHLTDLATDLQQPSEKRKCSRMKATLLALVGVATAISGAVANTNEFVGQVQELSDKLGIPLAIEQVGPQQKAIDPEQP